MPDVTVSDAIAAAESVTMSGVPNPNVSDSISVTEAVTLSTKPRLTVEYLDGSTWKEVTQYCPLMGDMFLGLPPVRTEAVHESNTGIATFSLNATGAALVSEGDEIRITDGISFYFFGGYIARIEQVRRGVDTGAICQCQDYNSLLDRTIVVDYTIDAGDTDSTEIGTLLTTYLPGISTGQIDAINSSMEAVTLLGTFRDSMAKIAGQANGSVHFWIDFQKQFYYVASRQDIAGAGGNVTLSDTLGGGNEPYGGTRYIVDNTRKVNRVYIKGDGVSGWVGSGDYEAIINDSSVKTAAAVTELGGTITAAKGSATQEYRVTTWEPDAYGELYLTFEHSDFHSSATIDVRRATMTPRSTDGSKYTITLELGEFSVDTTTSIGGNESRGVLTPGGSRGSGIDGIGTSDHNLLSTYHADTTTDAVTRGDIIIGNSTPEWTALAHPGAGYYLTTDASDVTWGTLTAAPNDAQYVTLALDGDLSAERVLTAGDGIDLTDGGANGNVTLAVDVTDIIGNGITESSNNIVLGTPSTLTVSTSNGVTASSHTHAITSSDNPGAAAAILATNASGNITLEDLYVDEYIWHTGDTDTSIQFQGDRITFDAGGVAMLDLVEGATDYAAFPAGIVYINDTSNGNMNQGLTINQGTHNNEAFAVKSSDVAHGMTAQTETDTYLFVSKYQDTSGGAMLTGTKDANGTNAHALRLRGFLGEPPQTTKTTSSYGVTTFGVWEKSSTTVKEITTANANLFSWDTAGTTKMILDTEGDLHLDGTTAAFDAWDDCQLIRALDLERAPDQVIRSEFDEYVQYNRDDLERGGIVTFNDDGHHFVNITQLQRLHNGAIWQLYQRCQQYERAFAALGINPALLEA